MTAVHRLRLEGLESPLGIDPDSAPRFTWVANSPEAVRVRLSTAEGEEVWASELGAEGLPARRYAGSALAADADYRWAVEDAGGAELAAARFSTGLRADDWGAAWIRDPAPAPDASTPAPVRYFRRAFTLDATPDRAMLYVTALGWFEVWVNGVSVTPGEILPRFTSIPSRLEYVAVDVRPHLTAGTNVLGVAVAEGRYAGSNSAFSHRHVFGDRVAVLAELRISRDGRESTVTTDRDWASGEGAIRAADPKNGERVDLRQEVVDWAQRPETPPGFGPVEETGYTGRLDARVAPAFRETRRLPPAAVSPTGDGAFLVDFGQNLTGVVELELDGPPGTEVRLFHSEVTRPDGPIDRDYLAMPPFLGPLHQEDVVIMAGRRTRYRPTFTVHGFRFVEVRGVAQLEVGDVEAIVLSSDLDYGSRFACSDPRLERLHENVRWSMIGNFMDVPADCPTRERSGWTGDAQVFTPTATLLADVSAFFRHWLTDLAIEQYPDGCVADVIPRESRPKKAGDRPALAGAAGWGDAAVMIPWVLYERTGDETVLERQYESMRAWVEFSAGRAGRGPWWLPRPRSAGAERLVRQGFHYGEWLQPGEKPTTTMLRNILRPPASVATAFLAHSARLLARAARVLGREDDGLHYDALAEATTAAWRAAFSRPDGRLVPDRQATYVRALAFDLLPDEQRPRAAERLAELVERAGGALDTGFLATPYLLGVLCDTGRSDLAFRVLLRDEPPSWLYPVELGATTIWETWSGYDRRGRARMSHNHYALGSVAQWLYEYLVGLRPTKPGWSSFEVRPHPGGGLTSAAAETATPFGLVSASWRLTGDAFELDVRVPNGTVAEAWAPAGYGRPGDAGSAVAAVLAPGEHRLSWPRTAD